MEVYQSKSKPNVITIKISKFSTKLLEPKLKLYVFKSNKYNMYTTQYK